MKKFTLSDPTTGPILWHQEGAAARLAGSESTKAAPDLGYPLIAQMAASAIEPMLSDDALREATAGCFSIPQGDKCGRKSLPSSSPLPVELIRGQDPQVVAARHLAALRQSLGKKARTCR